MENNEQWKADGDCQKCRRRKYCKTECRASREHTSRLIRQIVRKRTHIDEIENALGLDGRDD